MLLRDGVIVGQGAELIVEAVDGQMRDTMQVEPAPYRAFVGTLFEGETFLVL